MGACNGPLAGLLINVFAFGKLLLDNVDFLDVLEPVGPRAGLDADDTTHNLGHRLQHDQRARQRAIEGAHKIDEIARQRGMGGELQK